MLFKLVMEPETCHGLQMRRAALLVWMMGGAGCLRTPCEQDGLCFAATQVALRPIDLSLASADIDGDGHLDLVSVGGTAAALRRGHGDGSLAAPMVWTLPSRAEQLALGDLDGDGVQELVTTFPSRGSLAWVPGAVGGWHASPRELDVGADIRVLLTADLNGDGAEELIASEHDRGRLHLWMGAAAGPSAQRYLDIGGEAVALAAGDFHGDAGLELAVAIPSLGVVERRGFSPAVGLERMGTAWSSVFPASLVVADLDADGRDDLAGIDSLDRTLWIGLGDGDGGWHREYSWPLAETPRQVFARRGPITPELGVISGDGIGVTLIEPFTGAARIEALAASALQAVVTGDFVAGGSEELVYLHGSVAMVEELGGYRGSPLWTAPEGGPTGLVVVADLDGDEVPELIAEDTVQSALVVFAAEGAGYVEVSRYPLSHGLAGLRALARGDGGADLVWWEPIAGGLTGYGMLTYTPGSGLTKGPVSLENGYIVDIVAVDLNGDGWSDGAIRVESIDDSGRALVLAIREPNSGLPFGQKLLAGEQIDAVAAAQIDGVGGEDLWVIGDGKLRVVLGGEVSPVALEYGGLMTPNTSFLAADLNGDAQADLVICDRDTGAAVAYGHPDGSIDAFVAIAGLDPCGRLTTCDLDADGDLDLIVERLIDFKRAVVEVHRADPDGWVATGAFAFADPPYLWQTATMCQGQEVIRWSGTATGGTLHEVVAGPALRERRLPSQPYQVVRTADLDGDGLDDLYTHDQGAVTVAVAIADGEGGHQNVQSIQMPLAAGQSLLGLRTAELGAGPGTELLAQIAGPGITTPIWAVWSLRETELVALGSLGSLGSDLTTVGDFDGDGGDELLIGLGGSPQLLWVTSDGAIGRRLTLDPALLVGVEALRVADMDGDGMDDLLLIRDAEPDVVEVLRSRGDGSFEARRRWQFELNRDDISLDHGVQISLDGIGIGDLDGDGALDLVAYKYETLMIVHSDGDGGKRAASEQVASIEGYVRGPPLIDDLDGDGRVEVALLVLDDGQPDRLQVIRPGGAGEGMSPLLLDEGSSHVMVRMRLTADTPAWALLGYQGAVIVTAGGSP